MTLEKIFRPLPGPGRILHDFEGHSLVNGLVAFIFAASGPIAIVLTVGTKGGLSEADLSSWIFGCMAINGVISILFCLLYRQPLSFFWTIPGTVLVGPALNHLTFPEVIGAFYATGLLMLGLGLSGWVRKGMEAVPMPVVMAMVAGVFLQFGLDLVRAFGDGLAIALPMTLVYLALMAMPRLARLMPPLIGSMIAGGVAIWLTGGLGLTQGTGFAMRLPTVFAPALSWQAMVELVIPLAITVLVVQNGQGFAVLGAAGHKPPINAITVACGVGALVSAVVGAAPTCLTGPVNAIISSSGARQGHYTAGILVGLLAILFGLFSAVFVRVMLATPPAFIAVLAGLAMLRVLQTSFVIAFSTRFTLGALVTFLVTVSKIAIFNIGAPFWGLVFGFAVSWLLEREDFRALAADAAEKAE